MPLLKAGLEQSIYNLRHQTIVMNKLPFLKLNKWPQIAKAPSGESRYGYSEDDELVESAMKELSEAIESKDHAKLVSAIEALIDIVKGKQNVEQDQSLS